MGYRSFKDSTGVEWDAWDVVPQLGERRAENRRQAQAPIAFIDRRRGERRVVMSRRTVLTSGLASGWLCFDGTAGKRRLSPIPDDWARCPDAQLEAYCRMARPVRHSTEIHRHRP
ncbi:MAG: hypothetical protein M3303_03095 [Gemmatimonadota bacterium]|nr:hypothetical protein [Gemmatimonadota bacterium]